MKDSQKSLVENRIAGEGDLKELAELVNRSYRGESGRRGWTTESDLLGGQRTDPEMLALTLSRPQSEILLAIKGERIQGCVHLELKSTESCYLGMLTVSPEAQRTGLGGLLVKTAEKFAREKFDCTQMEMTVIGQRKELIAWYERRGYKVTGEREDFPYGNERFGRPLRPDLYFERLTKRI